MRYLGKLPYTPDHRDLLLAKYIDKQKLYDAIGDAPRGLELTALLRPDGKPVEPDTDPLYNNIAGSCAVSDPGHAVKLLGQLIGEPLIVTAEMVRDAYAAITGYDPITGAHDFGTYMRDVWKYWQKIGLFGTRALAYVQVDRTNQDEIALATALGLGLHGGYSLPLASQNQYDSQGRPQWEVPAGGWPAGKGPGSWGGHAVYKHGDTGNTWGLGVVMSWEWHLACCDELWMVITDKHEMANGRTPLGFDFAQLMADVAARTGSVVL